MPAGSSDRRRPSTAATAPASRSRRPRTSAACRSQKRRADIRRPDGRNAVPTIGPGGGRLERRAPPLRPPRAARACRRRGHGRRRDLGSHAAGAEPAAGAGHGDDVEVGRRVHVAQQAGAGRRGIAVVQPVDVGEQHQRVRADQVGDQRGEPVVVAEPDLVGGHGVVLVHHRHHAEPEQPLQRALGVAVVRAADHVVGGEQHLPDGLPVAGERRARTLRRAAAGRPRRPPAGWRGRGAGGRARAARARPRSPRRTPARPGCPRRRRRQRVDQRVEPGRVQSAGQRWSATTTRP